MFIAWGAESVWTMPLAGEDLIKTGWVTAKIHIKCMGTTCGAKILTQTLDSVSILRVAFDVEEQIG